VDFLSFRNRGIVFLQEPGFRLGFSFVRELDQSERDRKKATGKPVIGAYTRYVNGTGFAS